VFSENNRPNYRIDSNARVFTDTGFTIMYYAKELKGLTGIACSYKEQVSKGTVLKFQNKEPIKVMVGFFNKKESPFLKAPELETDASANEFGQSETKIANGLIIKGLPPVNIHTYSFAPGNNTLSLAKGVCLILGVVNGKEAFPLYDAGLTEKGANKEIDWLFE